MSLRRRLRYPCMAVRAQYIARGSEMDQAVTGILVGIVPGFLIAIAIFWWQRRGRKGGDQSS